MAIQLNDNLKINVGKPIDSKYLKGLVPYTNETEVLSGSTSIPIGERYIGLTVNIGNVEYWFKDDLNTLEEKFSSFTGGSVVVDGNSTGGGEHVYNDRTTALSGDTLNFRSLVGSGKTSVSTSGSEIIIHTPTGDTYVSGGTYTPSILTLLLTEGASDVIIPIGVSGVTDGVVSGGTISGSSLVLNRTIGLPNVVITGLTTGGTSTAINGLSINGTGDVVLGGTLTGDTTINSATFGILFGCGISCGSGSFAHGRFVQATGAYSHAEGVCAHAIGQGSHAEGYYTSACGYNTHAEGGRTHACGYNTHAEGTRTHAIGAQSHAGGYGIQYGQYIFASGTSSFIHSHNNNAQTTGHGAIADYSAILGGINHNIEVGNTGATIMGGNAIKLTGSSYIDTTAVGKFAIFTTPSAGASEDVLTWNPSTKKLNKVTQASIAGLASVTASNGLTKTATDVILGGSLTGNTRISGTFGLTLGDSSSCASGGYSLVVGCENTCATGVGSFAMGYKYSCATGLGSFAQGYYSCSVGDYSHASGCFAYACGLVSHAEGTAVHACGENSHAEGRATRAIGETSHSQGFRTCAVGDRSHTGGLGYVAGNKDIFACGIGSFNHSTNTNAQTAGYGANANFSAILGGLNHNIESGNTGAAIIGGGSPTGIKLTGSSYIDTTAVGKFAIMTSPTTGSSDQILARNISTGLIEITTAGGGGSATAINGLSINGTGDVVLGGTLTGNTCVNTANLYGIAIGSGSTATGVNSFATGRYSQATGANSFAEGFCTKATGAYSHVGGCTCESGYALSACGKVAFNHSANGYYQTSCGDGGADADFSAILGGCDNYIASGNTHAAIIGGVRIQLMGTDYCQTTAVNKLALLDGTASGVTSGSSNQVLIRNTSTGIIEYVLKEDLGGGDVNNVYDKTGFTASTGLTGVTLTGSEYVVLVETSGATFTVTLPAAPVDGQAFKIKDKGNALANNITIAGGTIDGAGSATINTDYGALNLMYSLADTEWYTLAFIS